MRTLWTRVNALYEKGRFEAMSKYERITHLEKLTSVSVMFSCWAKEEVLSSSREGKRDNLYLAEEIGVVEIPVKSQVIRLYFQYLTEVIANLTHRHSETSREECEKLWQNNVPSILNDFNGPGTRMETDFRIGINFYVVAGVISSAKRRRCLVRPSNVYDSSNGIMLDDLEIPVFVGDLCEKIEKLYRQSQRGNMLK